MFSGFPKGLNQPTRKTKPQLTISHHPCPPPVYVKELPYLYTEHVWHFWRRKSRIYWLAFPRHKGVIEIIFRRGGGGLNSIYTLSPEWIHQPEWIIIANVFSFFTIFNPDIFALYILGINCCFHPWNDYVKAIRHIFTVKYGPDSKVYFWNSTKKLSAPKGNTNIFAFHLPQRYYKSIMFLLNTLLIMFTPFMI